MFLLQNNQMEIDSIQYNHKTYYAQQMCYAERNQIEKEHISSEWVETTVWK